MSKINEVENEARMVRGEMYYAFTPGLSIRRERCRHLWQRFNQAGDLPRREAVQLWKEITEEKSPLPLPAATEEEDANLLQEEPYVMAPFHADYGFNVKLGPSTFLNWNSTFVDTCPITICARTIIGPNCSFYSGRHPLDSSVRNGLKGPEDGAEIVIGEDCWLGGNVVVLPGVTIGKGTTIGAGSVVTKDVGSFCVAVGNPARVLRSIKPKGRGEALEADGPAPE